MTRRLFFIRFAFLLITMLLLLCSSTLAQQAEDEPDFRPLLRKWLANEKLPEGVVSLTTFRKAKNFDGSEENVNISFLDLDRRGQKELAIQSGCAAVGNCQLDIFEKVGKSYRRLLNADMVQEVRPLSTITHGH